MKPTRGSNDSGGYLARKRRQARAAQLRQQEQQTPSLQAEAAREAQRIESERAARLHSRAQMFRQAAHDAHGYPTHGHVVLLPQHDQSAPTDSNGAAPNETPTTPKTAKTVASKTVSTTPRKTRAVAAKPSKNDRRDRNSVGWKRVRRLTWATSGVLTILCVGLALTRPEMNVREVKISGASLVPDRVLDAVHRQLVGQNIFRARSQNAIKTLKDLPFVQDVRVRRVATWPPQMAISVVERAPFARVGNGGEWLVADRNGVPFRAAQKDDDSLDALYNKQWTPVLGKALDSVTWKNAAQFAQTVSTERASGKNWNLKRIYFDEHGFVSVRLAGGFHDATLIQLGGDEWAQKLARARQALEYLESRNRRASVLNLITYSMPVWTPRAPVAPLPTAGAKPVESQPRNG